MGPGSLVKWGAILALVGCTNVEGDAPGECENGLDDDADGVMDCEDDGCLGLSNCFDSMETTDTADTAS